MWTFPIKVDDKTEVMKSIYVASSNIIMYHNDSAPVWLKTIGTISAGILYIKHKSSAREH